MKLIPQDKNASILSKRFKSGSRTYKVIVFDGTNKHIHNYNTKADALWCIKQNINNCEYIKIYRDDKLIETYGNTRIIKKGKKHD